MAQNNSTDAVEYLMQQVYKHYNVGFIAANSLFGWKQSIENIVQHKLDRECNDPNSIPNQFGSALANALPNFKIQNRSYMQFPNYAYGFKLEEKSFGTYKLTTEFEIYISLLAESYTFLISDLYLFEEQQYHSSNPQSVPYILINSFDCSKHRIANGDLNIISQLLENEFKNKKFVSHALLNHQKVWNVTPYPLNNEGNFSLLPHSLFNLLFYSNSFGLEITKVLE